MYYYIKGTLVQKSENYIVVDACGVGYMINTSLNSIANSCDAGEQLTVYTYLHVREDVMELYGFTTTEEKAMFLNLLSVSGVGPKAALAVLSVTTPAQLALAVAAGDVKTITRASGVGSKMAQRIILELKDKLKNADISADLAGLKDVPMTDSLSEALNALVALGYSNADAKNAVEGIDGSLSVEEIIKKALSSLL